MVNAANRVEEAINLKRLIPELNDGSEGLGVVFQDNTPPRRMSPVYSMATGELIMVPLHRLEVVLSKVQADGSRAFTSFKDQAPEYVEGSIKCFLARGSEQRGLVDQLNIAPGYYCIAEHLANDMAAITHAEHRHPGRWKTLQLHITKQEQKVRDERAESQTAAILELARRGQAVDSAASMKKHEAT